MIPAKRGVAPPRRSANAPATRAEIQARRQRQLRRFFVVCTVLAVIAGLVAPALGLIALGFVAVTGYARRIDLPAMVGIYAVVLVLVPSRYTVGSFAVTASMLVALLA